MDQSKCPQAHVGSATPVRAIGDDADHGRVAFALGMAARAVDLDAFTIRDGLTATGTKCGVGSRNYGS